MASASPRRADLLRQIGVDPIVCPIGAAESQQLKKGGAAQLVCENARLKAETVYKLNPAPTGIIIGADTVVILDGSLLGKPHNAADAVAMLSALSGKTNTVHTGICLIDAASGDGVFGSRSTMVRFATLSKDDIVHYVATGEPLDKAGGYGIQGMGGLFVEEISGDYGTVVGLSLPLLKKLANELASIL